MALWHQSADGDSTLLADNVALAKGRLAKARGLMFRREFPEGSALIFPFDRPALRSVHMLFVPFPIDVVWSVDDRVTKVKRLRPWIGIGWGRGDRLIELPAGTARKVSVGDRLVEGDNDDGGN